MKLGRLFWKILLGFVLTIVTVAGLVGFAVSVYQEARAPAADELARGAHVALMAVAAGAIVQQGGVEALDREMAAWPRLARERLLVVNQAGQDVFGRPVPETALAMARKRLMQPGRGRGRAATQQVTAPDGQRYLLFMLAPEAPMRPPPRGEILLQQLLLVGIAGLVFSGMLAWYLTRPIRALRHAFDRVAAGQLQTRIGSGMGQRRDEIADLGQDFDRMAQRLEQLVGTQRQMLHDVSHELRTPLARLQLAVGLLRQQPDRLELSLERIEKETQRLNDIVEELLTLARYQAGEVIESDEYFDVIGLLDEVLGNARFEAGQHVIQLDNQAGDEALVCGSSTLLYRALENVVRNALRHGGTAQPLQINVRRVLYESQPCLRVEVQDRGPGVPEADLERIFEPFVRLGIPAQTGGERGHGLGLAIVRRAVLAHGGRVWAQRREGGGLSLNLEIPLVKVPPA